MKKTNNIGNQTGPNNPPSIVMSEDKISSTDTKIEVNTYAMKNGGICLLLLLYLYFYPTISHVLGDRLL